MQRRASQLYSILTSKREEIVKKLNDGTNFVALLQKCIYYNLLLKKSFRFEFLAEQNWQLHMFASWTLDLLTREVSHSGEFLALTMRLLLYCDLIVIIGLFTGARRNLSDSDLNYLSEKLIIPNMPDQKPISFHRFAKKVPFHLAPFSIKDLDQLSLAQRIASCPQLKEISSHSLSFSLNFLHWYLIKMIYCVLSFFIPYFSKISSATSMFGADSPSPLSVQSKLDWSPGEIIHGEDLASMLSASGLDGVGGDVESLLGPGFRPQLPSHPLQHIDLSFVDTYSNPNFYLKNLNKVFIITTDGPISCFNQLFTDKWMADSATPQRTLTIDCNFLITIILKPHSNLNLNISAIYFTCQSGLSCCGLACLSQAETLKLEKRMEKSGEYMANIVCFLFFHTLHALANIYTHNLIYHPNKYGSNIVFKYIIILFFVMTDGPWPKKAPGPLFISGNYSESSCTVCIGNSIGQRKLLCYLWSRVSSDRRSLVKHFIILEQEPALSLFDIWCLIKPYMIWFFAATVFFKRSIYSYSSHFIIECNFGSYCEYTTSNIPWRTDRCNNIVIYIYNQSNGLGSNLNVIKPQAYKLIFCYSAQAVTQAQSAVVVAVSDEAFSNIRTVRSFAMEEQEARYLIYCILYIFVVYLMSNITFKNNNCRKKSF
uniref:Signal peptide protein n=1 Tax=Heterorhabditis bacteriophora TaxID=37862 RepID=A0A1I7WYY3_HETBA